MAHRRICRPANRGLAVVLLAGVVAMATATGLRAQEVETLPPAAAAAGTSDVELASDECCLVLLLPVSARAVALGRALTARGSASGVFANPAGLAALEEGQFVIHHSATVAGQANAVSLLFTPPIVGTLGVSYQLFDHGDIATTDENGFETGQLSIRDHVLVASYATHLLGGLSGGVNLKLYHFRIGCRGNCAGHEVRATTYGLDTGLHFRPAWLDALQLGVALSNLGFSLQVVNAPQADPLPTRVRAGAAYDVLRHVATADAVALWAGLELVDRWPTPGSPAASLGLEFIAADAVFLRAGYVPGNGLDSGAAIGVGVRHTYFTVDIAKSFNNSVLDPEAEPFQVSFAMSF